MSKEFLKARVKELAAQGRDLSKRIQSTSGLERHGIWNDKRALGRRTRGVLLVYGLLRGVSYARMEPRCKRDNRPQPGWLSRILEELVDESDRGAWSREKLEAWLQEVAVK